MFLNESRKQFWRKVGGRPPPLLPTGFFYPLVGVGWGWGRMGLGWSWWTACAAACDLSFYTPLKRLWVLWDRSRDQRAHKRMFSKIFQYRTGIVITVIPVFANKFIIWSFTTCQYMHSNFHLQDRTSHNGSVRISNGIENVVVQLVQRVSWLEQNQVSMAEQLQHCTEWVQVY